MRWVAIDQQACPSMLVSSQPTCTYRKVNPTTGAHVELVKSTPCAMDSASGSSLDAVQFLSMSRSLDTSNSATVRCLRILHSAMELISISGSGEPRTIVDSGLSLEQVVSGLPLDTGGSPSTNESFHLQCNFLYLK